MASISYTVASAARANVITNIMVDDQPAQVIQEKYIVELKADDGVNGTVKLILPSNTEEVYNNGDTVTGVFTVG